MLSMAHFLWCAPLKGQICVAHITNAPLIRQDILSMTLLVGPTWILAAHSEQYAPLVRKLLVEHICKCATSKY
jgi:hypothetical protein